MADSLFTIALNDLKSDRCACLRPKQPRMSFCGGCYHALPKQLQMKLYATMSDGYPENYDEAKTWLRGNTERFLNVRSND